MTGLHEEKFQEVLAVLRQRIDRELVSVERCDQILLNPGPIAEALEAILTGHLQVDIEKRLVVIDGQVLS